MSNKYKIILLFLISLLSIAFMAKIHLIRMVYPGGDLAADMLLTNQIYNDGYLLTGHYSRLGFNHPGPFFFYNHYLFEHLASFLLPCRYNAWVLATVFLNALTVTIAALLAQYIHTNGKDKKIHMPASIIFLAMTIPLLRECTFAEWMPYKICLPFLAFVLTLPPIAARKFQFIPLSMLLACILIHGYVTLPLFTLPMILLALFWGYKRTGTPLSKKEKKYIYAGLAIGLVFASPIIIDTLINSPCNMSKLFDAATSQNAQPGSSWQETLSFTGNYWLKEFTYFHYLMGLLGVVKLIFYSVDKGCLFIKQVLASLVVTLVFTGYYKTLPPPLKEYMGMFYWMVPLGLIMVAISGLFTKVEGLKLNTRIIKGAQVGVFVLFVCLSTIQVVQVRSVPINGLVVKTISNVIKEETKPYGKAIIHYENQNLWTIMAGVLLHLKSTGYEACTSVRHMAHLYTEAGVCLENEAANIKVILAKDASKNLIKKVGIYGVESIE